jgi:hypothetical protein
MQTVNLAGATFFFKERTPCLKIKQDRYELGSECFDTLLNFLKIPTKYLHRFACEDAEQASNNVNFWLNKRAEEIALAVRGDEVVSVIEADTPVVSSEVVFNALAKYLKCTPYVTTEGELQVATFRTPVDEIELLSGEKAFISIRLTYSECFTVTPRVDAVLTVNGSFANYYMPIQQRKFRVLRMSETHIVNEVIEFSDIVIEQIQKLFIPALERMIAADAKLNIYGFVDRLTSELRLSKRICRALLEGIEGPEVSLHMLVRQISNNLLPEVRSDDIDYLMARDIEIALSKAIMTGRFK